MNKALKRDLDAIVLKLGAAGAVFLEEHRKAVEGGAAPRAAILRAWVELNKTHVRSDDGTWARRETPADVATDARSYHCAQCNREQPPCSCTNCGSTGPTAACFYCGTPQRFACPDCRESWRPILVDGSLEERVENTRTILITDIELRSEEKGELIGWLNSELKDSHGTIITPDEVLRHLTSGRVLIDEEHNFKPVEGVRVVEKWKGQRRVKDPSTGEEKLVEGVGFKLVCDLARAGAKRLWDGFKNGVYRGFSIAFNMAKDLKEKIDSGVTDVIDQIDEMPFVSAVANPSNSAALLLEMRSATLAKALGLADDKNGAEDAQPDKPAGESAPDALDEIAKDVADLRAGQAPEKDATSLAADAAGNAQLVKDLTGRVEDLSKAVEQLRSASSSDGWKAGDEALKVSLDALTVSLNQVIERLGTSETRLEKAINAIRGMTPAFRAFVTEQISTLKRSTGRVGRSGVGDDLENKAAEHLRELPETPKVDPLTAAMEQAFGQ